MTVRFHWLRGFCFAATAVLAAAPGTLLGVTKTWDGSFSNQWATAANWTGGIAPMAGDALVFPTSVTTKSMNNGLAANISLLSLAFQDSGYSVTGNPITLSGGAGDGIATSGSTLVNLDITLAGVETFSASAGGNLVLSGVITLGTNDLTLTGAGEIDIAASITGTGGSEVTFSGAGRKEIRTSGSVSPGAGGATSATAGNVLMVNGAFSSGGTLTIGSSSVLGGTGSVSALLVNGTVAPGDNDVGRLTATGSVSFANTAGANLTLELGSASTAGTTYDQLRCNSTVSIFGVAALNLTAVAGYAPSLGQVYTLLDKVNTGAISGTFSGLPEGGTVALAGTTLRISYVGGTGNDITATVIDSTANDPPVNSVPGAQNTNEDIALVFSAANGNRISISDPDAGSSNVRVTLTATNGTATLGSVNGLGFTTGDGTNDAVMTFSGSLANCNAAMATLTFNPTTNFNGAASLQILTNDLGNTTSTGPGSALTDTDTISITVAAVNDAPTNTVPATQTTAEDTPRVFSTANSNAISVADVDAGSSALQVQLTATSGTITLSTTSGLSFSTGDGSADTTAVFTGSATSINAALNGMSFTPNADFNGGASLAIATSDQGNTGLGGSLSDSDTVAVTVSAVNDAPVNAVPGAQTTNEDTAVVFSAANGNRISVSDVDAGNGLVRVQLTVGFGTLSLNGTAGLTFTSGDGISDSTMTFSGTLTNINNALNGLSYLPNADNHGSTSISINSNDLGNSGSGGSLADSDSVAMTVNSVNDAPVITLTSSTQNGTEDAPRFLPGNFITISDADAGGSNPLQVTLTCTNGTATLGSTSGLTFTVGDGSNDAQMVFTGTIANINSDLSGLSFTPPENFNGAAQLQIVVNDQGNTGNGGAQSDTEQITFNFSAVNDAPVNAMPPAQTIAEESNLTFTAERALSTSDLDAGTNPIQVALTATSGRLTLSGTSGLSFAAGDGTSDNSMTFSGTQANIQAALEGMVFAPNAEFHGAASVQITTNDLGNSGSGGAKQDIDTLTINVTNVPDTRTWVASNQTQWATPSNWSPAQTPEDGDSLVFPENQAGRFSDNNINGNPFFEAITVRGGGYAFNGFGVSTNLLAFENVPSSGFFNLPLVLVADTVISASASAPMTIGAPIAMGVENLEFFIETASDQITMNHAISGTNSLSKTGAGTLVLNVITSYEGLTMIQNGIVRVTGTGTLGDASSGTSVFAGALLEFSLPNAITTAEPITLAGTLTTNAAAVTLSGSLTISGTPTLNAGAGGLVLSGGVEGSGQPASSGAIVVASALNLGGWKVEGGSLVVNGDGSVTAIQLSGGALGGTGAVGAVSVDGDGGEISPGGSVGNLSTGDLVLTGGPATLRIEADANGNDTIFVTGSVALGSSALTFVNAGTANAPFAPAIGQVLLVIDNDGDDAISGTLNGAAEGSVISLAFMPFQISYQGGDGNDLTLTRVDAAITGVTREWDGGGANALWSTPQNWVGDIPPAQGDTVKFPSGVPNFVTENDLPADFSINRLEMQRNNLIISGNRLRLLGDVEHSGPAPTAGIVVNTPFLLTKPTTFREAATESNNRMTLRGAIDTAGFNVTFEDLTGRLDAHTITVEGQISGAGKVLITGNGSVSIRQPTTGFQAWTGGTDVSSGVLFGEGFGSIRSPLRIGGGAAFARVKLLGETQALEQASAVTFLGNALLEPSKSINVGDLIFSGGNGLSAAPGFSVQDRIFVRGNVRFLAAGGSLVLPMTFTLAGDHEVEVAAGLDQVITGNVATSAGARLVKTGAGILRLQPSSGVNNAVTEARQGVLSFVSDQQFCPVFLNGGTLAGHGIFTFARVGAVTAEAGGGTIALGDTSLPPNSRTAPLETGPLTLNAATTFRVAMETRQPRGLGQNAFDQLTVHGSVSLGNATLLLQPQSGFEAYAGEKFTLIQNNSGSPISGTFNGVPEGQVITIGQFTFRCSYVGGDGNDFVVTVGLLPTGLTRVWDGGGSDNNWSNPANWIGDVAPVQGDSIELRAGTPRLSGFNDFPGGTTFHQLRVVGTGLSMSGNAIGLTGGMQINAPDAGFNFLPEVRLVGTPTISATGMGNFSFFARLLAPELVVDVAAGLSEYFSQGNAINLTNEQPALVVKTGTGRAYVEQTGSGVTGLNCRIDAGALQLRNLRGDVQVGGAGQPAKAMVFGPSQSAGAAIILGTMTLGPQSTLEFRNEGRMIIDHLVLTGGNVTHSVLSGTPTSELSLRASLTASAPGAQTIPSRVAADHPTGGAVDINVMNASTLTLTGNVVRNASGSFINKTGAGTLTLSGGNEFQNPLSRLDVSAGRALVNSNLFSIHAQLTGGTLGGNGMVGTITSIDGGILAPGTSAGLLKTISATLNAQTTLAIELGGTTPGITYDQLDINTDLDLGSTALAVTNLSGFFPPAGSTFVIVPKTGGGAVTSTFSGLPNGASFIALGRVFTINYAGGDGNDIAITCQGYDLTDSDNDTLADGWEQEFFGNLSSGANDDPDGDGKTNRQEFVAGTSPINYTSALRASVVSGPAGGMTISVRPVVAGRTYTLERSTTTLDTSSFQPVPNATFTDVGDERRFTDPTPSAGKAFYRVTVQPSP